MGLNQRIARWAFKNETETATGLTDAIWQTWTGTTDQKTLSEATYFTCLKTLSETMGKLPLKFYQKTDNGIEKVAGDTREYILGSRPNNLMSASTVWSSVELNCQHTGNSYIWMRYKYMSGKGKAGYVLQDMWPMPSKDVSILVDNGGYFGGKGGIYYQYTDSTTGEQYVFNPQDVLHFKTWLSFDGIRGLSVRQILGRTTIATLKTSTDYVKTQNEYGLSAGMALQYVGDLDETHIAALQKKYETFLSGPKNAGRIVPVPIGLQLTPLKMTAADAQFYELRKYTALQVAAAFGIKPNQLNDYEKSSYSNSETQQIAFLVDTMAARLKMYEEEINYKILARAERENGFYFKFNEKALLRTDSKSQMESLSNGVKSGIVTPNEARGNLDLPKQEGGDVLIVNGSCVTLNGISKKGGNET